MYSPPFGADYCHIKVNDLTKRVMLQLMGKNGKRFKMWTHRNEMYYIWWNQVTNVIELWGPLKKITKTKRIILQELKLISMGQWSEPNLCGNALTDFTLSANSDEIIK